VNQDFSIENYNYPLDEEKIAKYPLADRSKSKLLIWNKGAISHKQFEKAPNNLPSDSLLVFNDTKVIAARLLFQKVSGANIEIFLLNPELPTRDIAAAMTQKSSAIWKCMIGNKKRWKTDNLVSKIQGLTISASYHDRENDLVRIQWTGENTFAEIITKIGQTPLPPYLKRKPDPTDRERYQTVYSKNNGAVAAPTAGLHFTPDILKKIQEKGVGIEFLTLHVSAGTFKPVDVSDYRDHDMHIEQIVISTDSIRNIMNAHDRLIAVGTTSLRILESLFWYGVLLSKNEDAEFFITKDLPQTKELPSNISFHEALSKIVMHMKKNGLTQLRGETEIFIFPGYQIRSAKGLFTNFHLPQSTLLLLVSAFTNQEWKKIYTEALENDYRFLSYGDSSLLLR